MFDHQKHPRNFSPEEKLELQPIVDVQNVLESVNQLVVDLQKISAPDRKVC